MILEEVDKMSEMIRKRVLLLQFQPLLTKCKKMRQNKRLSVQELKELH